MAVPPLNRQVSEQCNAARCGAERHQKKTKNDQHRFDVSRLPALACVKRRNKKPLFGNEIKKFLQNSVTTSCHPRPLPTAEVSHRPVSTVRDRLERHGGNKQNGWHLALETPFGMSRQALRAVPHGNTMSVESCRVRSWLGHKTLRSIRFWVKFSLLHTQRTQ